MLLTGVSLVSFRSKAAIIFHVADPGAASWSRHAAVTHGHRYLAKVETPVLVQAARI